MIINETCPNVETIHFDDKEQKCLTDGVSDLFKELESLPESVLLDELEQRGCSLGTQLTELRDYLKSFSAHQTSKVVLIDLTAQTINNT